MNTRTRKYRIAVCIALLGILGLWAMTAAKRRSELEQGQVRFNSVERVFHKLSSRPPAPRSELEKRAWQVLREQLSAPDTPSTPSWETRKWSNKCDIGLVSSIVQVACQGKIKTFLENVTDVLFDEDSKHKAADEALQQLSASLRIPRQDEIATRGPFDRNEPAQLASVVFNKEARESLEKAIEEWKGGKLTKVEMKPGSILAKAIWNRLPMSKEGTSVRSILVYQQNGLLARDENGQLLSQLDLKRDYKHLTLDTSAPDTDPGCGSPVNSVHPDCFHGYPLQVDSELVQRAVPILDAPSRAVYNKCGNVVCYFILDGIHLMVRLSPDDPLYRDYAPWLFITFWWNGQDNHVLGDAPWKYYQVTVTQLGRNGDAGVPDTLRNIVFNPYLEGPKLNGAVSNCVSCHRFAEVAPKNADSLVGLGSGECFGLRPLNSSGIAAPGDCPSEGSYWEKGVESDLVWSLAELNDK